MINVLYNEQSITGASSGWTNYSSSSQYTIDYAGNFVTNRVITGATTNVTTFVVNAVNQYTSVNGTNYTNRNRVTSLQLTIEISDGE